MAYRFMRYPEGRYKAVTLSYDDGTIDDLRLADRLNKSTLKCTFNLNGHWLYAEGRPTVEQLQQQILDMGHEIAVHGSQHLANGIVPPIDGIRDVLHCREELEAAFGCIIRGMAYPDSGITRFHNGNNYDNIRSYLRDLGIVYARTLGGDNDSFMLPGDFLAWMPSVHHSNPALMEYIQKFLQIDIAYMGHSAYYPRLLYIWGHAYEFSRNDNWDLLDSICEKLGGHTDIWYATNMQLYEYTKAYQELIWSAKGDRVYNPNRIPLWFAVEQDVFCISPGETLKF